MADVVIGNREVIIDLSKLTIAEFRSLFDKEQKQEDEDEIMARVCGMTAEELRELSYLDYKKLTTAFFKKARDPLADPS